jgi:hypothetical protein
MAFNVSIVHINVAFSFRRIVGVAPVAAFTMQLLCRASDIEGVIAIQPPVDSTYLVYPQELILTNLVVEVLVASITGEILVFSVSPTSTDLLLPLPHPSHHCWSFALGSQPSPQL